MENQYAIEMLNITKKFPGIIANDNITLQLKKGEIHALLGENGAGKSTLMSVLFGLYQPEEGIIKKDGKVVSIKDPNDATALGIGMVHQHFKLVDVFTVLDNIILGAETTKCGFLQKKEARKKVEEISKRYGLNVDLDAKVEDITVGMQQRVEILKMLYRDNEILIFDEPTAVLTPQEIEELMATMKEFAREGKSILFISHKLNEIMEVSDRVSVLRKGKYIGTVNTSETTKQELSNMMVGRPVQLEVTKDEAKPAGEVLKVDHLCVHSHVQKRNAVNDVSFTVRAGEIVCIAGIDGNGQTELVYGLTGLDKPSSGTITLCGKDISHASIRHRGEHMSHIPEDRHKHGLVLDFTLEQNMVLQRFNEPRFENHDFINNKAVRDYANYLIDKFDVRSGQGAITRARSMSGGNQQKAIIAREVDRDKDLIVAVQPTRGLDVGAIEFIHSQLGRDLRLRQQHEDHHKHHKRHHHVGCIRAEHQHVAEHRETRCGIGQRDVVDERRTQPVDRERQAVHAERHRRLDEGEELLVLYLHVHHVKARLVELVVLVLLGVERVHYVDARQVFARHTVDLVGQLLHDAKTRDADAHHRYHRHADDHDECRCHGGELPALAENFDDGPHGHDRRFDHHLQAHRHDHLNLRDVVRRSRDEAGDGKILHLLAADVHHVAEELFAHREAEARRRLSREIPAAHGQHGACERAAKHFHADGQDIRRRPRCFDERRQIGHVIRQPQVKVDLHRHKHGAQQHHEHLFAAHVFE